MYTVFDPGHCGVSASVYEIAPLAVKYGIGGVAVPQNLLEDPKAGVAAADFIFDHGLRWSLLPTPADFFTESVTDAAFDSALEHFKRWADAGEKMGVRYCYNHVWNGSNARKSEAQFEWVLRRLRRIWKVADDHGLHYGMEFLGPCPLQRSFRYPFFNSLSGILALADAVSPRCGFLFERLLPPFALFPHHSTLGFRPFLPLVKNGRFRTVPAICFISPSFYAGLSPFLPLWATASPRAPARHLARDKTQAPDVLPLASL